MIILGKIFYFILAIGPLIFIHELGHFLLAKFLGVRVEKFSLGFGPKLIGKKFGETEYLLSAFPLGGYVKMFGESGYIEGGEVHSHGGVDNAPVESIPLDTLREMSSEEKAYSFAHKPPLARIAIVLAGPLFNICFAWLLYILLYAMFSTNGFPSMPPKVGAVSVNSPAERAGVLTGDLITRIDNRPIKQWEEIPLAIFRATPRPIKVELTRNGQPLTFTITPEALTANGKPTKQMIIGIKSSGEIVTEPYSVGKAIEKGTTHTITTMNLIVVSFKKLVQGEIALDNIGGPITIAKQANVEAKAGVLPFFAFMAMLSVNLGILNLLPVPVLDGGHLAFFCWELVFRRPMSQKIREYAQQIGLILLLGLMILAFYNDLIGFFTNHV